MNTVHGAQPIPNHMVWAILSTIIATLCCCPLGLLGIVGIVQANKVNNLLMQGDEAGARHASEQAKMWCWIATGLAILGLLINVGYFAIYGGSAFTQAMQGAM